MIANTSDVHVTTPLLPPGGSRGHLATSSDAAGEPARSPSCSRARTQSHEVRVFLPRYEAPAERGLPALPRPPPRDDARWLADVIPCPVAGEACSDLRKNAPCHGTHWLAPRVPFCHLPGSPPGAPPVAQDVGRANAIGGTCPHGRAGCSTGLSFRRRRGGRTSTHRTGNLRHALRCSAGRQSSGSQIGGSPRMRRSRGLATVRKPGARRRASTHVTPGGRRTGRRGARHARRTCHSTYPHADSLRCFTGALYGIL